MPLRISGLLCCLTMPSWISVLCSCWSRTVYLLLPRITPVLQISSTDSNMTQITYLRSCLWYFYYCSWDDLADNASQLHAWICLMWSEVKEHCNIATMGSSLILGSSEAIAEHVRQQLSCYTYTFLPVRLVVNSPPGLVMCSWPYQNPPSFVMCISLEGPHCLREGVPIFSQSMKIQMEKHSMRFPYQWLHWLPQV